jgi:hypothetical protein
MSASGRASATRRPTCRDALVLFADTSVTQGKHVFRNQE